VITAAPLTVAVLGAGTVGRTLARAWALSGHQIILGSRQPDHRRMADAAADITRGTAAAVTAASHRDAARNADVVAVTVPGDQVQALLGQLGDALRGQLVIDATNDISPGAPVLNNLAALRAAGGICYRAFNTVGWEQMARPVFGQLRADLPYTGPDATSSQIERLITDVGFRPVHLGDDQRALDAIDALARLWFLLAYDRGYGRRLAWRLLTEADDHPADGSAPTAATDPA
jgi:8-hydroxy-5-deazaflavin:NADPH oxidoreductase